jgi:hypothetical protein
VNNRKYQRLVLLSSAASAACLLVAFMHYSDLALASGRDLGWMWQLWALAPGLFCVLVWLFQTRPWLRSAGVVSTLGVLAYSAWVLVWAFAAGLGGDMAGLVTLGGMLALGVAIAWSGVALLIGWVWNSR